MSALDTQVGGSHYRQGGIQPVQFIEANKLQYLEASVVKRVTRHEKIGGKGRQDIEKAIHELQLLLELRYPKTNPVPVVSTSDEIINKVMDNERRSRDCLACGKPGGHGGLPCPNTAVYSQL